MSLGTTRNLRQALIAAAAATLLAGCAGEPPAPGVAAVPPASGTGPGDSATLTYWGTIGGAPTGNRITGFGAFMLVRPTAVAARGNFVLIYDAGTYAVYRYDRTRNSMTRVKDLSDMVKGEVTAVYLDPDLNFYVTDTDGGRVLYFDARGNLLQALGQNINLVHPVGVAVDAGAGEVLVADGANDFILVFDRLGNVRRTIGSRGQGPGQFLNITALAEHGHRLYVGTRFDPRLQVLDTRGSPLQVIDTATRFPTAVAVDDRGRVYVADYLDNTIKIYDSGGRLIDTAGGTGVGAGRFKRIAGLWVDHDLLYVADSLNGRIQVMRINH